MVLEPYRKYPAATCSDPLRRQSPSVPSPEEEIRLCTEVAAVIHGPVDGILRNPVQASHQVAGDVRLASFSKDVPQAPAVYLVGDDLGRDRQIPEQTRQVAGRL